MVAFKEGDEKLNIGPGDLFSRGRCLGVLYIEVKKNLLFLNSLKKKPNAFLSLPEVKHFFYYITFQVSERLVNCQQSFSGR